jgi:hypothetical protein
VLNIYGGKKSGDNFFRLGLRPKSKRSLKRLMTCKGRLKKLLLEKNRYRFIAFKTCKPTLRTYFFIFFLIHWHLSLHSMQSLTWKSFLKLEWISRISFCQFYRKKSEGSNMYVWKCKQCFYCFLSATQSKNFIH